MATVRNCIVKNSTRIRKLLIERLSELNKSNSDVVKDARSRGREITNSSFGRFINHGNVKSTLSQEDVVWLCFRYGIEIQLMVGSPKVIDGKITLTIPKYNEELCIKFADSLTKKT
jgi:hypothetical protein